MKKNINVHVVVASSTHKYFDYFIRNSLHTAQYPSRVMFYCYALDKETYSAYSNSEKVSGCYPVYKDKGAFRLVTLREWMVFLRYKLTGNSGLAGSNGHSAGLNKIMKVMPTMPGHHVIADSDVAILTHDWDTMIEEQFADHHLIGTTYEDIGGFSSGDGLVQTYKNFPNANWVAIREDCDLTALDWFPRKEKNIKIDTDDKAKLYGLPVGYEMVCDGGWAFPQYASDRGYKSKAMKQVKSSSDQIQVLTTNNTYNEEYQLDGQAFVGHQRGGSHIAFRASEISISFYDCVEAAVGQPTPPNSEFDK